MPVADAGVGRGFARLIDALKVFSVLVFADGVYCAPLLGIVRQFVGGAVGMHVGVDVAGAEEVLA